MYIHRKSTIGIAIIKIARSYNLSLISFQLIIAHELKMENTLKIHYL